jgi:acyl carrier protein
VAASAAIARDDDAGERILVGYIVPAAGARPTPARIRSVLATRLPEHMLPSLFVRLDALPLGPNGKLCRRALPDPDPDNILREEDFSAPRTEVERRVAALMAPLVGLERVGVDEHFFLLGGHSLLGAQLIARIRDVFGIQMSLRTLFDAPTVAKLSAEITRLLIERVSAMSEEAAEALLTESDHG